MLWSQKTNANKPHSQKQIYATTPKSNNTSGIIGVSLDKRENKWRAYIAINRKRINLGQYKLKEDAIKARLWGELKYLGKIAPQANLFEQYGITEVDIKNAIEELDKQPKEDTTKEQKHFEKMWRSEIEVEKEITRIENICFLQNLYQNNYYYE